MKFPICTAVLLVLLGTTASAYARQGNGQEERKQEGKPAKQQDRPAQQQRQARPAQQQRQGTPAARQQTQGDRPAQQQPTRQATQAQPQRQQTDRAQQPQTREANRTQQSYAGRNQTQVQQTRAASGNNGNRGRSEHGRISDDHYASSFGREHSFHVNRGEYNSRRFAYGGYSFGFVDPWPVAWGYSDDVYVVYADGGYYMYNRIHPGVRISINLF